MPTIFWIFTILGCAVLVGIWIATHEQAHDRQRKLNRIRKRLQQIEQAKQDDSEGNKDHGNSPDENR